MQVEPIIERLREWAEQAGEAELRAELVRLRLELHKRNEDNRELHGLIRAMRRDLMHAQTDMLNARRQARTIMAAEIAKGVGECSSR